MASGSCECKRKRTEGCKERERWEAREAKKQKDFEECRDIFMKHIPKLRERVLEIRAEEGHRESGWAQSLRCHNPRCGHTTRLGELHWCGFQPSRKKYYASEVLIIYLRCEKCGLVAKEEPSSSARGNPTYYYSCGCEYKQSPDGWMKFYRCKQHNNPGKVETRVIVIEEPTILSPPGIAYSSPPRSW